VELTASAEDATRLARLRYNGGSTGYLEVLTNDTNYYSAHLTLAVAQEDEALSFVQLYSALEAVGKSNEDVDRSATMMRQGGTEGWWLEHNPRCRQAIGRHESIASTFRSTLISSLPKEEDPAADWVSPRIPRLIKEGRHVSQDHGCL
jgi:hypothetical protein